MPAISIITPTRNRDPHLRALYEVILAQTLTDWEWLIHDDSDRPAGWPSGLGDPRVQYIHQPPPVTVGEKRNILLEMATAPLAAHFDDDDYYAPPYLEAMSQAIGEGRDFVKLAGWFVFLTRPGALGYWDTRRDAPLHYIFSQADGVTPGRPGAWDERNLAGYGFSYVYRRAVWQARPFDHVNFNEDAPFALAARERFRFEPLLDRHGLALHVMHGDNTSICFPQYLLPPFLLDRLFPPAVHRVLKPPQPALEGIDIA